MFPRDFGFPYFHIVQSSAKTTVPFACLHVFSILLSKPRYIQDRISWTENVATLLTSLVQIDKDWRFPNVLSTFL